MSTKERPSVAVKAMVRAKAAVRIIKTAPFIASLPKTKKIEKLPIPGKVKIKKDKPAKVIALLKKPVVKKHNLRKTVASSRELKLLITPASKSAKKFTSASKKSSVKRTQSKKKVVNSPRVAPVKPLPKKTSLPKSGKKVTPSLLVVNPPQLIRVTYASSQTAKKGSKSKSKPKVVKPANTTNTVNPTDTGKVIRVINVVRKPALANAKKSVTFVLQKKERKPSRYFELLAKNTAPSRVLPISEQAKQHVRKDAPSPRN